ncbi:MAG: NAD(P)-dependent glycerol-3-phosphate dehydrogenase [Alphaproteobacteria bacterium]|nr:NAD(P)-dependent glycerol-3-phosphate dehydrogenase [Alphaproteobacteria bacterium]
MGQKQKIYVVGAGSWGTALALVGARAGAKVVLCARDEHWAVTVNQVRANDKYLPGIVLPAAITVQAGYEGIAGADLVLLVTPAQHARATLEAIGGDQLAGLPVAMCAKGLEKHTQARQTQILAEIAPEAVPLVLSGPGFALDVARGLPTAVTIACTHPGLAGQAAQWLASPGFRPYTSDDPTGVELAGALKNIFAIACGAVEGAGLGLSARSAVLARSYTELGRFVVALGGKKSTLAGLAGMGDLVLSCTSRQSRNYEFGWRVGASSVGRKDTRRLTEGVLSAPVALELANIHKIKAPITVAVNALLDGDAEISQLVSELMTRPLRRENEDH